MNAGVFLVPSELLWQDHLTEQLHVGKIYFAQVSEGSLTSSWYGGYEKAENWQELSRKGRKGNTEDATVNKTTKGWPHWPTFSNKAPPPTFHHLQ